MQVRRSGTLALRRFLSLKMAGALAGLASTSRLPACLAVQLVLAGSLPTTCASLFSVGVESCYPRGAAGGTSRPGFCGGRELCACSSQACLGLCMFLGMGVVSCYPRGAVDGTSRPGGVLRVLGEALAAPTPERAGRG